MNLRKIIFWSHLLAGLCGGLVIFIMSATGVILMYEHQLVEYAERGVREVVAPNADAGRISLDDLVAKAREQNPAARPTAVVLRKEPTAAVAVNFGRDGATYVNPYTGAVLGQGSKLHDSFHAVIDWHRWLGMEGEGRATGRAITGACNLAFLWLAVTGVYLWWPRSWRWRGLKPSVIFNFRLRGKARDWNWHNVIGFWSSGVLVVLTLTGAVMSYPWANDLLYTLAGSEPPPRARGPSPTPTPQGRQRRGEGEARGSKPSASLEAVFARAEKQAPGWIMMMMRLSRRGDGAISVLIQEPTAPHIFARSQLTLNGATAEIVKWEPYAEASSGRKARVWVRGLHTGEALGVGGQTLAGLASLGGCFLVWTGMAMAWRRFRYRRRAANDLGSFDPTLAPSATAADAMQITPHVNGTSVSPCRMEIAPGRSTVANGRLRATVDEGRRDNGAAVLILYGTVTGNAESLAKKVAARLHHAGVAARVRDMAQCEPRVLTEANYVLILVSTYGDGEPPDDASAFCEAVTHGTGLDLKDLQFSVLALGNTTYDYFCRCGKELDAALERHGATRLYPRIDCDADYDVPARRWIEGVLAALERKSDLSPSA
jgi:uncharacterized iron-regulated membrane protein/flavodoxin